MPKQKAKMATKKAQKVFEPTSEFAPIAHGRKKAKAPELDTNGLLKQMLDLLQKGQPNREPEIPQPPPRKEYTNATGFPPVRTFDTGGTLGGGGETKWFDSVNNEWRSFDGLMSRIGQLEAFRDAAQGAIAQLNKQVMELMNGRQGRSRG